MEPIIEITDTAEKYIPVIDRVVPVFVDFLRKLSKAEEDANEKQEMLEEQKDEDDDTFDEDDEQLWAEFNENYSSIARTMCTEKLLERLSVNSFSMPTKYGHINEGCKLEVTMKSSRQLTIIMYNDPKMPWLHTYRFVLKEIDGQWKVNTVHSRLGGDSWSIDKI